MYIAFSKLVLFTRICLLSYVMLLAVDDWGVEAVDNVGYTFRLRRAVCVCVFMSET